MNGYMSGFCDVTGRLELGGRGKVGDGEKNHKFEEKGKLYEEK